LEHSMMFWLNLLMVGALLIVAICVIAFLEEKLVSGPRRKELERKRREKLGIKEPAE
jgi:hypothetical protein